MTDFETILIQLKNDFEILREREAKYGGNAPLELLTQIEDHETAVKLVQAAIAGELTEEELDAELAPLNLVITRGDQTSTYEQAIDLTEQTASSALTESERRNRIKSLLPLLPKGMQARKLLLTLWSQKQHIQWITITLVIIFSLLLGWFGYNRFEAISNKNREATNTAIAEKLAMLSTAHAVRAATAQAAQTATAEAVMVATPQAAQTATAEAVMAATPHAVRTATAQAAQTATAEAVMAATPHAVRTATAQAAQTATAEAVMAATAQAEAATAHAVRVATAHAAQTATAEAVMAATAQAVRAATAQAAQTATAQAVRAATAQAAMVATAQAAMAATAQVAAAQAEAATAQAEFATAQVAAAQAEAALVRAEAAATAEAERAPTAKVITTGEAAMVRAETATAQAVRAATAQAAIEEAQIEFVTAEAEFATAEAEFATAKAAMVATAQAAAAAQTATAQAAMVATAKAAMVATAQAAAAAQTATTQAAMVATAKFTTTEIAGSATSHPSPTPYLEAIKNVEISDKDVEGEINVEYPVRLSPGSSDTVIVSIYLPELLVSLEPILIERVSIPDDISPIVGELNRYTTLIFIRRTMSVELSSETIKIGNVFPATTQFVNLDEFAAPTFWSWSIVAPDVVGSHDLNVDVYRGDERIPSWRGILNIEVKHLMPTPVPTPTFTETPEPTDALNAAVLAPTDMISTAETQKMVTIPTEGIVAHEKVAVMTTTNTPTPTTTNTLKPTSTTTNTSISISKPVSSPINTPLPTSTATITPTSTPLPTAIPFIQTPAGVATIGAFAVIFATLISGLITYLVAKDSFPIIGTRASYKRTLVILNRNLARLQEQEALHGMDVPTKLANEIEMTKEKIAEIEAKLSEAMTNLPPEAQAEITEDGQIEGFEEAMTNLPPEAQTLATHLDALPDPAQINIQYATALLLVESGKAQLIKTEPGEAGAYCTFETVAGDVFTMIKPPLSEAEERAMVEKVREILAEEGGL